MLNQFFVLQDLQNYFKFQKQILVNGSKLIEDYKKKNVLLENERISVIRILANHLLLNKKHPTKEDKIKWAKCAIYLFPVLKDTSTPEGYVRIFFYRYS